MGTGFTGTFVISWTQTELDGLSSAPLSALRVGTNWSWTGEPVRVDGPSQVLRLGAAVGEAEFRQRVGRGAQRIVGPVTGYDPIEPSPELDEPLFQSGFTVTDGRSSWPLSLVQSGPGRPPLLMVKDDLPPRGTDLWVVGHNVQTAGAGGQAKANDAVVCFTPGTRIQCEHGTKLVDELLPGDRIQTRDNGCQPLVWLGRRHVSGARLKAMPELAPVRLAPGALDGGVPDESLLVSPSHRILLRGPRARALWNEDEVLVEARDLVDHDRIFVDRRRHSITYMHLYLPSHQVVFANGVESESFHPAFADLTQLSAHGLSELKANDPDIAQNPDLYGAPARRMLSHAEARFLTDGPGLA